ncbi:TPA: hypothetical protein ACH3X1_008597 [Trebouxia sp. C0004]
MQYGQYAVRCRERLPQNRGDVQDMQLPILSSEDSQDMATASGAAEATAGNSMQTALDQLDLPPEQQEGLIMDIIKAMPDPSKHPKFLKQRRSQSRSITLSDYCRPSGDTCRTFAFLALSHAAHKSKVKAH